MPKYVLSTSLLILYLVLAVCLSPQSCSDTLLGLEPKIHVWFPSYSCSHLWSVNSLDYCFGELWSQLRNCLIHTPFLSGAILLPRLPQSQEALLLHLGRSPYFQGVAIMRKCPCRLRLR